MRGVIDETGYSPFWESLGKRFFSMEFARADYLCGTGQKAFIAELMPKHPIYTDFLSRGASGDWPVIRKQRQLARYWKEASATATMSIFSTAGQRLSATLTAFAQSVKVWLRW
jgi:arginine/ornithine succinyltransferase subunit-like protein